jgi:hypothetical protein
MGLNLMILEILIRKSKRINIVMSNIRINQKIIMHRSIRRNKWLNKARKDSNLLHIKTNQGFSSRVAQCKVGINQLNELGRDQENP